MCILAKVATSNMYCRINHTVYKCGYRSSLGVEIILELQIPTAALLLRTGLFSFVTI